MCLKNSVTITLDLYVLMDGSVFRMEMPSLVMPSTLVSFSYHFLSISNETSKRLYYIQAVKNNKKMHYKFIVDSDRENRRLQSNIKVPVLVKYFLAYHI